MPQRFIYEIGYFTPDSTTESYGVFSSMSNVKKAIRALRRHFPKRKWMEKLTNRQGFVVFRYPLNVCYAKSEEQDKGDYLFSPRGTFGDLASQKPKRLPNNLIQIRNEACDRPIWIPNISSVRE